MSENGQNNLAHTYINIVMVFHWVQIVLPNGALG